MQKSIYSKLTELPLFLGMSHTDLEQAVGQLKFGFHKFAADHVVAKQETPCTNMMLVTDGLLTSSAESIDHGYVLSEEVHAPTLLEPEHLFGLQQRYSRTFTAKEPCHLITLDKTELTKLMEEHLIVRFNMLNLISAQGQKLQQQLWQAPATLLESRIVRFIANRSLRPAGPKTLYIKMQRLAVELNDSRLNISRALNHMQALGLLKLYRERIEIPAFEQLLKGV